MPELNNNPENLQTITEDDGLMQLPEELEAFFKKTTIGGEEIIADGEFKTSEKFDYKKLSKVERVILISYYNEKTADENMFDVYERFNAWKKYACMSNNSLVNKLAYSNYATDNEEFVLTQIISNRANGDFDTFIESVADSQGFDTEKTADLKNIVKESMKIYNIKTAEAKKDEDNEEDKPRGRTMVAKN